MRLSTRRAASPVEAVRPDLLLAALLGLALQAMPAIAAEAVADADEGALPSTELETVEVVGEQEEYTSKRTKSATRTDTPLLDIPQSITVVTDDLIRDQSMQNMADVVRYVPGVQMAQGEGHRDAPILRGNASTADFFLDGLRDDIQYFRDLYNVEQVEVLKGPSGMIFGRGGSGGLINRVTKQANWSDAGALSLTFGSWANRRVTGDYNQPVSDGAAFRVTGLYQDSDSYRDFGQFERRAINPTLTLRAGDATTIALGLEHFSDERVTDRGVPSLLPISGRPLPTDPSTFFGNPDLSRTWADVDAFTTLVTHEFDSGAVLTHQARLADYDKFYQNVFASAYSAADERVSVRGYSNHTRRRNMLNQTDLTFSTQTGSIHHGFMLGLELGHQETDNLRKTAYFPDVAPDATTDFVTIANPIHAGNVVFRQSASDADNHGVARTAAVYVQDQIEFSPHWQAILGVRFDRFDVDLFDNRGSARVSSTDDLFSPRAGLIFKPRDDVSIYASYAVAYVPRAGEQLASLNASNRNLEPEEFENLELGAKWDLADGLSATAALYRLDRTNVAIVDPLDPARMILVDGQRVSGLEVGLAGRITDAWQVMAGYARQDSEVKTPGASHGNELGQVPGTSFSLWNRYDFGPRFGIGLGLVHRDDVFASTDNAVTLPGFTRVDAAAFLAITASVRLQLNVENVLDRDYHASAHGNNNIMPGSPRAARLGLDVAF